MEGKFSLLFLCSPALPLFILYLLFIFLRSLCCPLHFCHPFFFLYTLSNSLQYHHTREKSFFFSPSVTLYLCLLCSVFHFLVCPHHTIFLLAFLPLPLSHNEKTTKSIPRSLFLLRISESSSFPDFAILFQCRSERTMEVHKHYIKYRFLESNKLQVCIHGISK